MEQPVPVLDYRRTVLRPRLEELPVGVREAIGRVAGSVVVAADPPAASGFSGGFAAAVHLADGRSVFAKAGSSSNPHLLRAYAQEAMVLAKLPAAVPAPRLLGAAALAAGEADDRAWQVVVTQRLPGRMPLPWTERDLAVVHEACLASAEALTPPPAGLDLGSMPQEYGQDRRILATVPALRAGTATLTSGQPGWLPGRWDDLEQLVAAAEGAVEGDTACHCDLRADNLLVDGERAVLLDWNWLCRGAAWTDFVGLLPLARSDGVDADSWLRRSELTRDVDAAAIDAWLALVAAYMLGQAEEPLWPGATAAVRVHQRRYARTFLDWLAARRGWL